MNGDRFRPDAAVRRLSPQPAGSARVQALADPGAASFDEERQPIGHRGRLSIPWSHRGEGVNHVD